MPGSLRQPTNPQDQFFPADAPCLLNGSTIDQFGYRRAARHRRHASFGEKANVSDPVTLQLQRKFQNIPARGVFQLRRGIRLRDLARITRVLKVIEEFRRVHSVIVTP